MEKRDCFLLMCGDVPVYDITNETVLNPKLLPGLMQQKGSSYAVFSKWMKYRYSSGTNTLARKLKGITFGQGARMRINRETRALSFSDSYWIREASDPVQFSDVSPYYQPFWDGSEPFCGQAAPTLYVGGALSKEWRRDGRLYKYGDISIELECVKLCAACNIPTEKAEPFAGGVAFSNISSPDHMLEQADQSGRLDPDDFDESTIIELFGKSGAQMLIIDAIIGNGDRHAGNFGWLRDTRTGDYVQMAPLYDFDHALDSTLASDRLLTDAVSFCHPYANEIRRIAHTALHAENPVFRLRAASVLKLLDS